MLVCRLVILFFLTAMSAADSSLKNTSTRACAAPLNPLVEHWRDTTGMPPGMLKVRTRSPFQNSWPLHGCSTNATAAHWPATMGSAGEVALDAPLTPHPTISREFAPSSMMRSSLKLFAVAEHDHKKPAPLSVSKRCQLITEKPNGVDPNELGHCAAELRSNTVWKLLL